MKIRLILPFSTQSAPTKMRHFLSNNGNFIHSSKLNGVRLDCRSHLSVVPFHLTAQVRLNGQESLRHNKWTQPNPALLSTGRFWWSRTWVGLTLFSSFHYLPRYAWADGSLAELAEELVKMLEHPNQSQPNPAQGCDHLYSPVRHKYWISVEPPCTYSVSFRSPALKPFWRHLAGTDAESLFSSLFKRLFCDSSAQYRDG